MWLDNGSGRPLTEICKVMCHSKEYANWTVRDLCIWICPAIQLNQFKFFVDENGVCGFFTWAHFDDRAHRAFSAGLRPLEYSDWISGTHVWIIDFVVPFNNGREAAWLAYRFFQTFEPKIHEVFAVRNYNKPNRRVVRYGRRKHIDDIICDSGQR